MGTPASPARKKKVPTVYTYTNLNDVKSGTVVNVFGVVKFLKRPTKTKGSDYCQVVSIHDPSLENFNKLKCLLFVRNVSYVDIIQNIGDIVRMHRLKIVLYHGELQGQAGPGFACLVFDGWPAATRQPRASSAQFTLTQTDHDMVRQLRTWQHESGDNIPFNDSIRNLNQIVVGQYFDLTCQVIATCTIPPDCVMLRVWDGTKTAITTKVTEMEKLNSFYCDNHLAAAVDAANLAADISVFDDHVADASKVKPADYICLHNLHVLLPKQDDSAEPIIPELCLHTGRLFDRHLSPASPDSAATLREKLEALVPPSKPQTDVAGVSGEQEGRQPPEVASDLPPPTSNSDQPQSSPVSTGRPKECETSETELNQPPRIATVISGHRHMKTSTLRRVKQSVSPNKFRVSVQIIDYQPHVAMATDFVLLHCERCQFLCTVREMHERPDISESMTSSTDDPPLFLCPQCESHPPAGNIDDSPNTAGESRGRLKYICALEFLVRDSTDEQTVHLWRDEATLFLRGVTAERLLTDGAAYAQLRHDLDNLCDKQDSGVQQTHVDCCIFSYVVGDTTCYHMFNTTLRPPGSF